MQVAITSSIPGLHAEVVHLLSSAHPHLLPLVAFSLEVTESTTVVLGEPSAVCGVLDTPAAVGVQWVQSTWAGVNRLADGCGRRDFVCTRVAGFGPQMVEYCLGVMLHHSLRLSKFLDDQKSCSWDPDEYKSSRPPCLGSSTVGILGSGDIGSSLALALSSAFGCPTVGLCRRGGARTGGGGEAAAFSALTTDVDELLERCDVVINTLPSTSETRGMLSLERFSKCKERRPLFINIGRGDITTCEIIEEALEKGYISRAVLDVFETEPLPRENSIWRNEKVTITPHISAVSSPGLVAKVFVDNLALFAEGKELKYIVDLGRGY